MIGFVDKLPQDFDYVAYVRNPGNADLASFDEETARKHYQRFGATEGRICSAVRNRKDFLKIIPLDRQILEIGPFFSPAFKRTEADVYYLDWLSTAEMQQRAQHIKGATSATVPEIDYVWSGQRYAELINRKFQIIYSAHNLEHQPCLISHLQDLEAVLETGGAVFLALPDKRYCFDHFFPETMLSDVIDAWKRGQKRHRLKDIMDHYLFTAHNDPARHWRGDHGINRNIQLLDDSQQALFFSELDKYCKSNEYIDVHASKFTPISFKVLFENLYSLKLTKLRIARLYSTVKYSNEFYVVLVSEPDL